MKHPTACNFCREAKRKCCVANKRDGCTACHARGEECSLTRAKRRRTHILACSTTPRAQKQDVDHLDRLLSDQTQMVLVDYYFLFIHDRPQSLFHEPTLRQQIKTKEVDKGLLIAICSLTCRFSDEPAVKCLGPRLTEMAKQWMQENMEKMTLAAIQTCILIANSCVANLDSGCEALYFGIAIRMAQIIKLPYSSSSDSQILSEVKRRVWWTLYMADRWCSSNSDLPRLINDADLPIDLPIDESEFQKPDYGSFNACRPGPGFWAYKTLLANIFGHIQDLNRKIGQRLLSDEQVEIAVHALAEQLDNWEKSLPRHIQLSEQAIEEHCRKGIGGSFIDLHLGYHHYCTLLYFNYLDSRRSLAPENQHYSQLCKDHALKYAEILQISRQKKNCAAVHPTVGHMTVVSSAVLVHTMLFGDEHSLKIARASLISNFNTLLELKKLWPMMNGLIMRLFHFQDACLSSTDLNPHRMDGWMARFLVEYTPSAQGPLIQSRATSPQGELMNNLVNNDAMQLRRHGLVLELLQGLDE